MRSGLRHMRMTSILVLAGTLMMGVSAPPVSASSPIWSVVPSPNPATISVSNDVLEGVSALADNNVWAVGNFSSSNGNNVKHSLVEHWNGTAWGVVPSPNVGSLGKRFW